VTIVGVDTSGHNGPQLVVLHRGPKGIYAETIEFADEVPQ
jgi:hypothetical protein